MPSSSPIHGLPYPLDSDPLADIALAVQQLADRLDGLIQADTVAVSAITAGTWNENIGSVTFAKPFGAPPRVFLQHTVAYSAGNVELLPRTVTAAGFKVAAKAPAAVGAGNIFWVAINVGVL